MKNLIETLEKDKNMLYDYISNNGHSLSPSCMIKIIKELDFAIYTKIDKKEYYNIIECMLKELKEWN